MQAPRVEVRRQGEGGSYVLAGSAAAWVPDANRFLDAATTRGLSSATVRAYAFDLLDLHRWMERLGWQLPDLNRAGLLAYIADQRDRGAQPASINRRLSTCSLFYRFVTGQELPVGAYAPELRGHYRGRGREHSLGLHTLPRVSRVQLRVRTPRKLVEPLSREQVSSFLLTLKRYRDLAIVYLMLFCGLRSREVIELEVADIDVEDQRLVVMGKGRRERTMPLTPTLLATLQNYLRFERPADAVNRRLFLALQGHARGTPMTAAGLRSLFRHRRSRRSRLSNANPHRFRHTFGANMARAGVGLAVLQRMMGHADTKTTLLYVNLSMADVAAEFSRATQVIEQGYRLRR